MEPTEKLKYSPVDIDARQVANYSVNRRDPGNNRAKGDRCSHPIFWKRKTSVTTPLMATFQMYQAPVHLSML
jgi:hypothetical protein